MSKRTTLSDEEMWEQSIAPGQPQITEEQLIEISAAIIAFRRGEPLSERHFRVARLGHERILENARSQTLASLQTSRKGRRSKVDLSKIETCGRS